MGKDLELSVGELVQHTMTRRRGQEAAEILRNMANSQGASRVSLHMSANSLITTSFIDELVRQAANMERSGIQVIFVIANADTLQRLQTSVTWRKISCRYRHAGESTVRTLKPSEIRDTTSRTHIATKSELLLTT